MGHKFGGNLTRVQIIFQNALNWPKLHSHHVSNFKDIDFSVSGGMFLHSIHLSCVLLHDGCHKPFASSAKVTPLFAHHPKYCVHLVFCAP